MLSLAKWRRNLYAGGGCGKCDNRRARQLWARHAWPCAGPLPANGREGARSGFSETATVPGLLGLKLSYVSVWGTSPAAHPSGDLRKERLIGGEQPRLLVMPGERVGEPAMPDLA